MQIALVHYAYPPVVGGVEFVMEQHAALFTRHGYKVKIIAGRGESDQTGVEIVEIPELLPGDPRNEESQRELAGDGSAPTFEALKTDLKAKFTAELAGCDVVFVHNMMTMHFNMAATSALAELGAEGLGETKFVSWVHDLAAIDPNYDLGDKLGRAPWDILSEPPENFAHAIISAARQEQFCALTGVGTDSCPVVPNGVRHIRLLRLTENVRTLCRRFGILYQDIVMLQPTRILRRKNIEFGIRVLAELKRAGHRATYLVTGAPDPHNPATRDYGKELQALVTELDVGDEFHFVSESFPVTDDDLVGLYNAADLLFLPSRQEGFGLPLLEAGVFRMPVFCPRVEPMQSILKHNVSLFGLDDDPKDVAARVARTLENDTGYRSRKEVIRNYSWDKLLEERIRPLFLA
jgi:glycosyltransferase involved in cell wall biosynthesis